MNKEGTKTIFPVPMEEASTAFDKLVASKKKKGYLEAVEGTVIPKQVAEEIDQFNAPDNKVLEYLAQAANGTYTNSFWK